MAEHGRDQSEGRERLGGTLRPRHLVSALVLLLGAVAPPLRAGAVPPPEAFLVMGGAQEGPQITPFLQDQLDRAWTIDAARAAELARVTTEAELLAVRGEMRRRVLEMIGGLPEEKAPLNARVVGSVPEDGYRIEKLVFESLPGVHVTALVYVPDAPRGAKPAVLLACGHSPLGKAYPAYQEIAIRLARRGFVVLCWDPVGQGERSQFWDRGRGRSRYNLVCGEHAVLGNLATLAGTSLVRYLVWDGVRAVDYLLTRGDVDPARLAITGTSGGGLQTTYVGGLDPRIAVVLPSCFPTALPMRMANRIFEDPDSDPEQDPPGLVGRRIDHAGLLLLTYPRALHVSAAVLDFFPIEGTRRTMRELSALYRRFGHGDRIELSEGYHKHAYSAENQQKAFAFLDRQIGRPPRDGFEPVKTLDAAALRCTPGGQVREDLGGKSLPEVIRDEFRRHPPASRQISELYFGDGYAGIRDFRVVPYAGRTPERAISWEDAGTARVGATRIDRYRLHHGDRLVVPLLRVRREGRPAGRVLLLLDLEGKLRPSSWPIAEASLEAGDEVLSFDPRGLGETRMRYRAASADDPTLAPEDEAAAYASPLSGVLANHVYNAQLLGRPYFLEMMEDAEIAVRFARAQLGARRVAVTGLGDADLLARAVAATLPDVTLVGPPRGSGSFSWREAVEGLREVWPIHDLVPGGASLRIDPPQARR